MTKTELFELHQELCSKALELMKLKNQDYSAHSSDPFKNFKGSVQFDVEPEVGLMIRMNDKFMWVHAFLRSGELAVQSEGIDDIGMDLINYTILLIGQLRDRINLASESPDPYTFPIPDGYRMLGRDETIQRNDSVWGGKTFYIVIQDQEHLVGTKVGNRTTPVIRKDDRYLLKNLEGQNNE